MRAVPFIVTLIAALPATVLAQEAEWEELHRQGLELREQGRDGEAEPLFSRAYALSRNPRTAAQLGLVEQALGRFVEAEGHLREALADPTDPWIAERREAIDAAHEFVLAQLVRIEISANVAGAEVLLGGELVATLPRAEPLRVLPGEIELTVRADGYVPEGRTLRLSPGSLVRQSFLLERPATSAEPEGPAGEHDDGHDEVTTRGWSFGGQRFTWVALGATAAFGGAALGTWLRTESQFDELRDRCGRPCPESEIDPLERRSLATQILFGLTMASGVFTLVLFYVEGRETRRVEVGLGPGQLSVEGRF